MKTLLVLRHAKSSWSEPDLPDHDRPLNRRGQRDAPRMGRLIKQQGLTPSLILSSTAVRAHTTARYVAQQCGCDAQIDLIPRLYLAGPQTYLDHLYGLDDNHTVVMVVGHNPGLEDLLERLTGAYHKMPTAALAHLRLDASRWQDVTWNTAQLIHLWRPKDPSPS